MHLRFNFFPNVELQNIISHCADKISKCSRENGGEGRVEVHVFCWKKGLFTKRMNQVPNRHFGTWFWLLSWFEQAWYVTLTVNAKLFQIRLHETWKAQGVSGSWSKPRRDLESYPLWCVNRLFQNVHLLEMPAEAMHVSICAIGTKYASSQCAEILFVIRTAVAMLVNARTIQTSSRGGYAIRIGFRNVIHSFENRPNITLTCELHRFTIAAMPRLYLDLTKPGEISRARW